MDTTTAATKASVTVATIRTWCRRNVVSAVKAGGKWDIDETTLNRRIALSRPRTIAAVDVEFRSGKLVAIGTPDALRHALEANRPVTITGGTCTGDIVYLGENCGRGITGLVVKYSDGTVGYAIDRKRLDQAPATVKFISDRDDDVFVTAFADQAAENAYLNPRYM